MRGRANSVFVDTSAWYATVTQEDSEHSIAAEVFTALAAEGVRLVTSNHVIGEAYTLLRARQGYRAAVGFLDRLERSTRVDRVFTTEEMESDAYGLLRQYSEQSFSFVDAVSFVWMRRLRLVRAFSFDRHFLTAGFTLVPGEHGI